MARDSSMPLPPARGRAVSADAARSRGGPSSVAPVQAAPTPVANHAPASQTGTQVADLVAHDPALEQLRSRKVKRTGLNVHINSQVHNAFAAFIDEYELPKGDATSLAIQEFLERRGVQIPGVARVLPLPVSAAPSYAPENPVAGGDSAVGG